MFDLDKPLQKKKKTHPAGLENDARPHFKIKVTKIPQSSGSLSVF